MHSAANSFSREITRHFDSYFEEFDIATSYAELLLILHKEGQLPQNRLAEEMKLAPSTITRFVNKLVKMGLLNKSKSGRTSVIILSKKGKELVPLLRKSFDRAVRELEEILGYKYVHTTRELLLHGANILREKQKDDS